MNLEESLGGGYSGLYGEVVTTDVYHMRDVADIVSANDPSHVFVKGHKKRFDFIPTIVIDLGCNVGIYTRYCRQLFPDAKIISVEPHPENFQYLSDCDAILINKAIGNGRVWRSLHAPNGSGECYLSKTVGLNSIDNRDDYELSNIETITIKELFEEYVKPTDKVIVKMDIEGGENSLMGDVDSVKCLLRADYFVMEYHNFGATGQDLETVTNLTNEFMNRFKETHNTEIIHPIFYASKL